MLGPSLLMRSSRTGSARQLAAGATLACALLLGAAFPAGAATYYVDNTNPGCINSGATAGSASTPYCTISAAASQHPGAGNTIRVLAGTYREQVSIPAAGASGSPFVIEAVSPSVTVDGADDFTSATQWTQTSGDVWLASGVTWLPKQVFSDGARLAATTVAPASMPAGTFQYVAGTGLYVNAGGGNPAGHGALVGRRLYGFTMSGKPWVIIRGFTATHAEDKGFLVQGGSHQVEITDNRATLSFKAGIQVTGSNGCRVARNASWENAAHGIALTAGSTGCTVEDNESYRNADPVVRVANGLYLFGAPANVLQRNRLHDNQDSGMHIQSSSIDCISVQNRSWSNGDHGFDHLGSTGTLHVGDVAWGNFRDGFSIEGSSGGTRLFNCIATENGITANDFDLWVDASSVPGFVSDYNLFWNSTAQPPVKFMSTLYASVEDYSAASGQDANTIQSDPQFVNPATGDFRLQAGSPAIDNANSAVPSWPAQDASGIPRLDDPATPNAGIGPVAYADRGAHEFPPTVLTVLPSTGAAPFTVTADATGSYGPDGTVASYRFDFGDGTVIGPQPGPIATHTYAAGTWTVTVTVTDQSGSAGTATASVIATAPSITAVDQRVAARTDDAEESAGGSVNTNGIDLELVQDNSTQTVGMRWPGLAIPKNAIIQNAHIQFAARISDSEATSLTIRGQAADNASTFTTSNNNVSSRPRTTAAATWAPPAWSGGQSGAGQRSPDLSAVIDEIVNRPGWASGNALALIVTGTGRRTAWSWDGNSTAAPLLHVEYTQNFAPQARLSVHQLVSPPLTMLANASASTDTDPAPIASYRFDFGDGSPAVTVAAPAATAQHAYAAAGIYTVTLTATDTRGLTSSPVTSTATVNGAPTARLSVTQLASPALTVRADASTSTDPDPMPIASYRFDFGDGSPAVVSTSPTAVAQHAYAQGGTYTVTLTVTDAGGLTSPPATASLTVNAPPTARLAVAQTASPPLTIAADASTSTDPEGAMASYRFDFGDGTPPVITTAPTAIAQHTYATPGTRTITVVATDTAGYASTPASAAIMVNGAPTARLAVTQPSTPPLAVIANASASTDPDSMRIASYRFDFGDGTPAVTTAAPNATAQHAYAASGTYVVTVTVTDAGGLASTATASMFVDAAPVAQLAVTQAASPPLTVNASASASTDADATPIASYRFDFGDGTPAVVTEAPAATASHTYSAAGSYTVTLIATDSGGFASAPATVTLVVNGAPTARLSVAQAPSPPLTVSADASASTDPDPMPIASYRFDFGDGTPAVTTTASTATAQHSYAAAGTYVVTVTATDAGGLTSTATASVAVESVPIASLTVTQLASPPLGVSANGSASTAGGGSPIATYRFDFGDGTPAVVTTAPTATTQHTYAGSGSYLVSLTVTNTGGLTSLPSTATVVIQTIAERRIAAGSDDSEENSSGKPAGNSDDLELVYDAGIQTVGMRWTGVAVPRGATITSAWIQFAAKESHSEATSVTFRGQAADNAAGFGGSSFNISSRPRTTEAMTWAPAAWTAGQAGANQRTPNLSAVIQEIVNRPGWASGNALAIIVTGTGHRTAWSFNGNASLAPLLHIEYTPQEAPPVARLSVSQAASPPLTAIADGSASTDGDATPIATYRFDFGDGTPAVTTTAPTATAQHTYAAAGTYPVTLTATDTGGLTSAPATASVTVTVDDPPVARLTVTQAASPPLTVNASGSASTDSDATPIATYRFNFGDGTPVVVTAAPTATAQHTYAAPGTYVVSLTATDTGGLVSAPDTAAIIVNPPVDNPPVARLTVTQAASPPLTAIANGSTSTDGDATPIATYWFDFGDGTPAVTTTAPTATALHTYAAPGTYTVTLVATDTGGLASAPATASITLGGAFTLEQRIAGWIDDVEEAAAGTIYVNSSDLEIVQDGSTLQTVGMRWPGLAIPPGATITSAWIQFASKEAQTGAVSVTFRAEASDNAATFGSAAFNLSARPRTTAGVPWAPVAWAAGEVAANQRTPDLKTVIQEIVSRPGWASGNAIAVIVTGTGRRTAWAYDGNAAAAPLLHVEYTTGPAPALTMTADAEAESGAHADAAKRLPAQLSFSLPYPNPSAGVVSFRLELPVSTEIRWGIYDVQGRRIWSEERASGAGRVELSWSGRRTDGSPVGSGLYFARVHAAGRVLTRRFARL